MSLTQFIKRASKSQYFRALIVRAIEDAVVLFCICVGIAVVCVVVGGVFRLLGVA